MEELTARETREKTPMKDRAKDFGVVGVFGGAEE